MLSRSEPWVFLPIRVSTSSRFAIAASSRTTASRSSYEIKRETQIVPPGWVARAYPRTVAAARIAASEGEHVDANAGVNDPDSGVRSAARVARRFPEFGSFTSAFA